MTANRTDVAGRVRVRDKSVVDGLLADLLVIGRRPVPAGKQRADAPAGDPGYGQWHVVKDIGGRT